MVRPRKNAGDALLLVVKDLIEGNQNISDIGTIIGVLGDDSTKWLEGLKKECFSVEEFIEVARQRADIALVAAATRTALGYNYEESYQNYLKVPDGYDKNGIPKMRDVPGNRQTKYKKALPNEALLRFLLRCRLPEYFQDVQRVEVNKKVIEIKEHTEEELRRCAGKLYEAVIRETDEIK